MSDSPKCLRCGAGPEWMQGKVLDEPTSELSPATGSAGRDGNWMDKWGACKVCDGEIPYGHTNNCDIYKMECQIRVMRDALKEVLSHRKEDKDGNYVMWIGEGTFIKCNGALNPPNVPDEQRRA